MDYQDIREAFSGYLTKRRLFKRLIDWILHMHMKRHLMPIMITVLMSILVISQASVHLSGNDGTTLLKELTNLSLNVEVLNNTTSNLSNKWTLVQLSGANGTSVLMNLTNGPSNRFGSNITDDLSNWGSRPRAPPLPSPNPNRQLIEVLRLNHGIV